MKGGPFPFDRKRMNKDLVLWSCEAIIVTLNYHLLRLLSTSIDKDLADNDKSDTTFFMLYAKLIMILTRTNT